MGQQLGLGLCGLRELLLQHLCNPLMEPLPGALQQRLIGRLLDEGVFEDIRGLRRQVALVEQFPLHQPPQRQLQHRLLQPRDGVE
jgi:hypothetical protein